MQTGSTVYYALVQNANTGNTWHTGKYIRLENHWVFHTLSQQLVQKPVMKKVCACALHEGLHVWDEGDALAPRQQNLILEEREEVLYKVCEGWGQTRVYFNNHSIYVCHHKPSTFTKPLGELSGMCKLAKALDPLQFPLSECILMHRVPCVNTATL